MRLSRQTQARTRGMNEMTKKGKAKKDLKFILHIETTLKPDKRGYHYSLFGDLMGSFVCDAGDEVSIKTEVLKDITSFIDYCAKVDGRSTKLLKKMKRKMLKYTILKETNKAKPEWKIILLFSRKRNAKIVQSWLKKEHGVKVAIGEIEKDR